ncbi:MAG: hypothetical protein II067_10230 [Agathobacter sp.]|uniref:DUF5721 family protein n=1 Tax=Agathobacter sp. TaxID=2021311 RepID=UPI00257C7FA0|nr:DUF5721 family protein [Agathobacter sp.]MBQ1682571.1 hypothetical protein [Agathobacter sp.]
MIAIKLTNHKNFMNALLRTDVFDHFLLQEATIAAAATYHIDGRMSREYYTQEEIDELGIAGYPCLPYGMLRNTCFDLIKGKKTPSAFNFVLMLSPDNLAKTLASLGSTFTIHDIGALFINLRFADGIMMLTTGVSYRTFQLDKSLDGQWDHLIQKFLDKHEIAFEIL